MTVCTRRNKILEVAHSFSLLVASYNCVETSNGPYESYGHLLLIRKERIYMR